MKTTSTSSLHSFEQYLQSKDLSQTVIKRYIAEAEWYSMFLVNQGKAPENATKKDILDYLKNPDRPVSKYQIVVKKELTNSTKNSILGILNHLYTYLVQEGQAPQNLTRFIKIRGVKRRSLRHLFTPEELEQLCDLLYSETYQIQTPTTQQQKDYIILTLAAYQALHIHEIDRLEKDDFNLRKATVKVQDSRKANGRTLALDASQIGVLMQYFNENPQAGFITSIAYVEALNRRLRKLYPGYENFIQLRSSVITQWIKIHGLRKAQYLAGHRYISSTENYLHNDFDSLQNDLDNFHPLSTGA